MSYIAITGANGFVGQYLVKYFAMLGFKILGLLRQPHEGLFEHPHVKYAVVGEFNADTNFKSLLQEIDIVIHCAARVHVMNPSPDDAKLFYETNVAGTLRLYEDATKHKVKQFIFLSSIKVNGERTI